MLDEERPAGRRRAPTRSRDLRPPQSAQQVKEIEEKLTALEKEFPGCGSTPGEGESVDASTAGMTNAKSEAAKFPSFKGKDLDGNDVNSDELFSNNKVTVMNF